MWDMRVVKQLAGLKGAREIRLDQCAYGATSKKATKILTNAGWLEAVCRRCEDVPSHDHTRLRGTVEDLRPGPQRGQQVWRTTLAAEYPQALCDAWAHEAGCGDQDRDQQGFEGDDGEVWQVRQCFGQSQVGQDPRTAVID